MNCKPGDLARVIANSKRCIGLTRDVLVTVHALPPPINRHGDIRLPDGCTSQAEASDWLIEFPSPVVIQRLSGNFRQTRWVTCADKYLRPIRDPGDDARDETLEWLPVPVKEIA